MTLWAIDPAATSTAFQEGRAEAAATPRRPRQSLVAGAAHWLGRHAPTWRRARSAVMQWAAFAALDAAAWREWGMTAGVVGIGVSLLVLEWLGGDRS